MMVKENMMFVDKRMWVGVVLGVMVVPQMTPQNQFQIPATRNLIVTSTLDSGVLKDFARDLKAKRSVLKARIVVIRV